MSKHKPGKQTNALERVLHSVASKQRNLDDFFCGIGGRKNSATLIPPDFESMPRYFLSGGTEFERGLVEDCLDEKVFEGEPKKEWSCCYTSFEYTPSLIIHCWKKDLRDTTVQLGIALGPTVSIDGRSEPKFRAIPLNVSYARAKSFITDAALIIVLLIKLTVRFYTLHVPRRVEFRRVGWRLGFPVVAAIPFMFKYLLELWEQKNKKETRVSESVLVLLDIIMTIDILVLWTMCIGELSTVANRVKFSRAVYRSVSDKKKLEGEISALSSEEIDQYMKSQAYRNIGTLTTIAHKKNKRRGGDEEEVVLFSSSPLLQQEKTKNPTKPDLLGIPWYKQVWLRLVYMFKVLTRSFVANTTIIYQSSYELFFDILGVHSSYVILVCANTFWMVVSTKLMGVQNQDAMASEHVTMFSGLLLGFSIMFYVPTYLYYYRYQPVKFEIAREFWFIPLFILLYQIAVVTETWSLVGHRSLSCNIVGLLALFFFIIWFVVTIYISSTTIELKGLSAGEDTLQPSLAQKRVKFLPFKNTPSTSSEEESTEDMETALF